MKDTRMNELNRKFEVNFLDELEAKPFKRQTFGLCNVGNKVYICGGEAHTVYNDLWEFNGIFIIYDIFQ